MHEEYEGTRVFLYPDAPLLLCSPAQSGTCLFNWNHVNYKRSCLERSTLHNG
jgi:hypothetical protein